MNDDRISEVYKGEIWTEEAQARARSRINWMLGSVQGTKVLDVGCSQGIASILLGREGFEVVGVDVQPSRIEYARQDLEHETVETQARVSFEVANGTALEFDDETFDTVLLGEVIEHLAVPDRILSECQRVLKEGGRLVATTPFGVLHHHDHKQTFYPDELFRLLSKRFKVSDAQIEDRYFRVVAEKGGSADPSVLDDLRAAAFDTVRQLQEELHQSRLTVNRQSTEISKERQALEDSRRQTNATQQRLAEVEGVRRHLEQVVKSERAAAADAKAHNRNLVTEYDQLRSKHDAVSEELRRTVGRLRSASGRLKRHDSMARRLARLERDNTVLRHRIAVRDWKLASLRRRRWWLIGAELGKARRSPLSAFRAPIAILRVLRAKPQPLPRPLSPSSRKAEAEQSDVATPAASDGVPAAAITPHYPVPALACLSADLAVGMASEIQAFDLHFDSWRSQVEDLAPTMLLLDAAVVERWRTAPALDELVEAMKAAGASIVLWDVDPSPLTAAERSVFDVIVGDGKPPVDDFGGRLIKREGQIAPSIHNPVGSKRRQDVGIVDFARGRVGDVAYRDTRDLCELAKRYKVLEVPGNVSSEQLTPLVASGTPLIVTDVTAEFGIVVDDEVETKRLELGLLRSEVLRARLTHPNVRQLLRQHNLHHDVAQLVEGEAGFALPQIDVMVATKRPHRVDDVLRTLASQTYPNIGLVLVAHGIALDESEVRDKAGAVGVKVQDVVSVDQSVPLGEVFNIGFSQTSSEVVAKMDDDDFYGPEYLWDLYDALSFSRADVAGKWAHFVYLEGVDSLIYRFKQFEHRFTEVVAISTLLMHRHLLEAEKFPPLPYGSGSLFLRALGRQGARVYAADRWNYLYVRGEDGGRNTFPVTDIKLLSNSDVVCKGKNIDHVLA